MTDVSEILFYIQIILFCLNILVLILYNSIPIILVQRFRIHSNLLTPNVCLACLNCTLDWLVFLIMAKFDIQLLFRDSTCGFLLYIQMMCIYQASYSIILISINQFCDIVYYTNRYFKTNQWLIICIAGLILSIPAYSPMQWITEMKTKNNVVILSLVCVIIHAVIFNSIRLSTRRVQPRSQITQISSSNIQRPKVNRRDAHLVRHMIFVFTLFVIEWGFSSFLAIVSSYIRVDQNVTTIGALSSEISALSIVVDFFVYNHEVEQYL